MKADQFTSRVERLDSGLRMHVIPVPEHIGAKLGQGRRVLLTINGVEECRALQGVKSGSPFIMLGKAPLKAMGLREGSPVKVSMAADPDPDRIDLAEELVEALDQDPEAKQRWETFTPGKQRSINLYVDGAKRPETRARRAVELTEKIRTHTLYGD